MDLLLGTPNPDFDDKKSRNEFLLDDSSDLQFDVLGNLRTVVDGDKLTQEVGKALLTDQGTNLFEDQYGTILHSFVGIPVAEDTTFALMKQTILDSLGVLISIHQDSDNPKEKIATVESIAATFNENKRNEVRIDLEVSTEANQVILTSLNIPLSG